MLRDELIPLNGLSAEEVEFRKLKALVNTKDKSKVSYFGIVVENTFTVFNIINFLIISGLFYFYFKFNDNRLLLDSIGILIVIFLNTLISIYQKIKAVRALEQVEILKKSKVKVIRDGHEFEINSEDVVLDDILVIRKGDQIPVDCVVVESKKFEVDESLITGESLAISRQKGDNLYSGSFCVNGIAYARVIRIGKDSYSNQIIHLAKKFKLATSPLMNKVNLIFSVSFLITLILIFFEGMLDVSKGDLGIEEIRRISTIAFTIIPEGLIFFSAITFAIGIYRISKIGAIVQKLNAIDSFTTVDIICLDKTGTITKNEINLSAIINLAEDIKIQKIEEYLGSFYQYSTNRTQTIEALSNFAINSNLKYLDDIPFDSEKKFGAVLFENSETKSYEIIILGALDILTDKVESSNRSIIFEKLNNQDLFGKRNLLLCKLVLKDIKNFSVKFVENNNLEPLAIVSFKDAIREDFVTVVEELRKKGKDFKVLTGDSTDSTYAILKETGISVDLDEIIDCRLWQSKEQKEIEKIVMTKKYFARLTPRQKLNIVKILKSNHQKVCFIGDGINDLPAIKEADLGIAMEEGMTITKEVSDIILQKNKFSLLPAIFDEGNRIINTVRYITTLYLVKNFTVLVMLIANWLEYIPFVLTPRKSSLLSALAVGLPSYFISFKNSNIKATGNFYKIVFRYVLSSSFIILFFSYSSYLISISFLKFSTETASNIMYSVFTLGTIASFFTLIAFEDKPNYNYYGFYAILMSVLFITFSFLRFDFPPLNFISAFYEFEVLNLSEFMIALVHSIVLTATLMLFHSKVKPNFT